MKSDPLVPPESPVSLATPDVQVQRDVWGLWVNWADPVLLVLLDHSVTLDLLGFLVPMERKVLPEQWVVPGRLDLWAAATASATPW